MVVAAVGLILLTLEPVVGIVVVVIGVIATAWFGLGSFSIPKMYMAEQYPTRLRGLGTSVGEMISRGLTGGILVAFLPGLFDGFGVTAVLTAAAVMMVLLAARCFSSARRPAVETWRISVPMCRPRRGRRRRTSRQ